MEDLVEIIRGVTYKKADSRSEPAAGLVPIVRATNVARGLNTATDLVYVPKALVKPPQFIRTGDVVIASSSGSASVVGKSAVARQDWDGGFGAFCTLLRPAIGVDANYLGYFVASPIVRRRWSGLAGGTNINNLKREHVAETEVPLAPLAEQRRIVAAIEEHLSRVDGAQHSLEQARSRLAGLRAGMLAAATDGFETLALGDLVTDLRYGTSVKCSPDAAGPPVLRIPNVQRGTVDLSDLKYSTDVQLDRSAFSVQRGDLLFVRTNGSKDLIGRVASVDGAEGMAFASYLIRARPDPARLDSRFAVIGLSTPNARAAIESKAATTAGQYNLNLAALRSLQIPLPAIDDQRSIVAEVEHRLAAADALEAEIDRARRQAEALRRSVLARAFRGELVPQETDDEPAGALLERIAAERAAAPVPTRMRQPRTQA